MALSELTAARLGARYTQVTEPSSVESTTVVRIALPEAGVTVTVPSEEAAVLQGRPLTVMFRTAVTPKTLLVQWDRQQADPGFGIAAVREEASEGFPDPLRQSAAEKEPVVQVDRPHRSKCGFP
ncbi:hypothetical protein [Streptomyces sp. NBC_01261]|uniref:hypothetical protein n=1 Tax=Streptomyces sp. NBC_01261 TaxID=2903802 RepID=UPI003FCD29FA